MCRMVGMTTASPIGGRDRDAAGADRAPAAPSLLPSWEHLVGAPHALRVQALQGNVPENSTSGHQDSWGVGWFDEAGLVSLLRQTGSAAESAYFVFASEAAARGGAGSGPARTLIGHLRKASCGVVISENAHPVRVDFSLPSGDAYALTPGMRPYETLLVAHNGTLRPPLLEGLRADLEQTKREEGRSDSDTVVLAGWLAARLSASRETTIFAGLGEALKELFARADAVTQGDRTKAYSGVNLLIGHASGLYALRAFSKEPSYYTLSARSLRGERDGIDGWVVASEATDSSEGWSPLMPGMLMYYPSASGGGGEVRTISVMALAV